ncbi:MAG: DUF4114 domain-containing protein [Gallionellaceae bacterium]
MPLATILNSIEASEGISLMRVSDYNDQFWSWAGDGEATVQVVARFAGYDDIFGVIPAADSGLNDFIPVVSSLSNNGISLNGTETPLPELSGEFLLAISTPSGQIWTSLATDNSDSMDHMVTWVNANDPENYFVAFEDLAFPGADGDFNDIVLELNNVVDGPSSVPEPGILALMVLGFAGLGYARRRKGLGLL